MEEIVGCRFRPTDKSLIDYIRTYCEVLGKKTRELDYWPFIAEVDIGDHEPWRLPELANTCSVDPEWYFLNKLGKKYPKGERIDRRTKSGFWKSTGPDREIKDEGKTIGTKKTLVFHKTEGNTSVKTDWIIHEYRALDIPPGKPEYVICKLMYKGRDMPWKIQTTSESFFEVDGFHFDPVALNDIGKGVRQ